MELTVKVNEIWKTIDNYPDYKISTLSNVKSFRRGNPKILKPGMGGDYLTVSLCNGGKPKTCSVHQLMAMTFLDHKPDGFKIVVDHIDGNKLNNNLDNLQLLTNRGNLTKNPRGKSKLTGVGYNKKRKKYQSQIIINGKTKWLGRFNTEAEAAEAYKTELNAI